MRAESVTDEAETETGGTTGEPELFDVEVENWCYALTNYAGEVDSRLVHFAIRELQGAVERAVRSEVLFDLLDISLRLSRSAKYLVDEREICFGILRGLPDTRSLNEAAQFTLAQIVDQAEQAYGGALEYLGWSPRR